MSRNLRTIVAVLALVVLTAGTAHALPTPGSHPPRPGSLWTWLSALVAPGGNPGLAAIWQAAKPSAGTGSGTTLPTGPVTDEGSSMDPNGGNSH
jgi:hypothetical protein